MDYEASGRRDRHDGQRATLIVMVGLPATGKTTVARRLEIERGALRLTPDEWMIPLFNEPEGDGKRDVMEGRFVWLAVRALRAGVDVILDFGVWSREERSALRFLAAEEQSDCEIVYVTAEHDEQLDRISRRKLTEPNSSFDISSDDLTRFRGLFQEPDSAELNSKVIDSPPDGYSSWSSWIAARWPTSTD